ncbi:hypothetical protein EV561_1618 [Rhizobium sp. BK376]|nr:hypothetical protein EV561_1618 [Rhizobium sp. BK376]
MTKCGSVSRRSTENLDGVRHKGSVIGGDRPILEVFAVFYTGPGGPATLACKFDEGPHSSVNPMQENGAPQASTIKHGGNVIRDLTCYAQSLVVDFL